MKRVATPFNERSWKLENISVATGSGKCVFYFFKNTILKAFYLGNNNFWQGRPVHSHPCLLCSLVIFVICLCFEVLGRQLDHQSDYAIAAFVNFSGNADFHLKHQICGLFHLFFVTETKLTDSESVFDADFDADFIAPILSNFNATLFAALFSRKSMSSLNYINHQKRSKLKLLLYKKRSLEE